MGAVGHRNASGEQHKVEEASAEVRARYIAARQNRSSKVRQLHKGQGPKGNERGRHDEHDGVMTNRAIGSKAQLHSLRW